MSETAKPAWPKLPNGTTNWETVFEDPVSNLIPVIAQAQTATALRQCTMLVIEQLHTRKSDPEIVARFVAKLDAILPDTAPAQTVPKVRDAITGLLRRIKDACIATAAAHIAAKESAAESGDVNKQFLAQMETAAGGNGPKAHVYGGALTVGTLAGRTSVTAQKVPPGACESVAWSLAAKGNVMISGVMPNKVHPAILKELCGRKIMGATLTWLSRKTQ
ncbi:MAG: hypothetical protein VW405_03600 [Rhodospirillaceae bacterium]